MAHQLTAEAWRHLRFTPGLEAVVLRDLLTKLSEATSWSPKDTLEFRIHFICWAKTILDHQRARLQATDGAAALSQKTRSCSLVSQDLLLITLSALLSVKRFLFPPTSTTASAHICCRVYNLAAIVCGLRLLLLRNEAVPRTKLNELIRDINANWKHTQLVPVEQFLLYDLIPDAVRRISALPSATTNAKYYKDLGIPTYDDITNVRLRKLSTYAYDTFSSPVVDAAKTIFDGRAESYWHFFDVMWAADAALIQCFNEDLDRPMDAVAAWTNGEDRLYNAVQVRSAVLDGISLGTTRYSDGHARASLTASLSSWEFADPTRKEEHISRVCELGSGRNLQRPSSAATFLYECTPYIEAALNNMIEWLGEIGSGIPRPDSPLLPDSKMPNVIRVHPAVTTEENTLYHPIPHLPSEPDSFAFTSSGNHILIWDKALKGVLKYKMDISFRKDILERRDYIRIGPEVLTLGGGNAATAVLTNTNNVTLDARGETLTSKPGSTQLHSLMLYRNEAMVETFTLGEATPIDPRTTSVTVNRADSLVALCLNGTLSVYEIGAYECHQLAFDDRLELYRNFAQKRVPGHRAESRLSRRLSIRRSLVIPHGLTDGDFQKEVDVLANIRERKISFSPTNNHLIVATLLTDDHVYIDVFTYNGHSITIATSQPSIFAMPSSLPADNGLRAALLNEDAMEVVFTADIGRPYPVHVSLAYDVRVPGAEPVDFGKKVVCAAQTSDGKSCVMVSGVGGIVSVVYKSSSPRFSTKEVKRLRRAGVGLPSGLNCSNVAVTMAEAGRAAVAWRSRGGKLMVRVIQLHSEEYADYSLH